MHLFRIFFTNGIRLYILVQNINWNIGQQTEWFPGQLIQAMRQDLSFLFVQWWIINVWSDLTTPYSSLAYLFIYFRTGGKRYTNGGHGIIDPVPPGSASGLMRARFILLSIIALGDSQEENYQLSIIRLIESNFFHSTGIC